LADARREAFVQGLFTARSASAAAIAAGYAPRSARNRASRLLRDPAVMARLAALRAERQTLAGASADLEVARLEDIFHAAVAQADLRLALKAVVNQSQLLGLIGPASHGAGVTKADTSSF